MAEVDLIEAYYAVSQDLERNGREQLEIAGRLARYANMLTEQRLAQQPAHLTQKDGPQS